MEQESKINDGNFEKSIINQYSIDELVENGKQWNQDWLISSGKDDWLANIWKIMHKNSEKFSQTSCEVTSAMIRWKFGIDECIELENVTFKEVMKKYPLFQITIGIDNMNNEHVITIYDNHIIQSYFNKYTIQARQLNEQLITAIDNITNIDSYSEITGVNETFDNLKDLKVFYWIPKF